MVGLREHDSTRLSATEPSRPRPALWESGHDRKAFPDSPRLGRVCLLSVGYRRSQGADLLVHDVAATLERLFAVDPAMKRVEARRTIAEDLGAGLSEAPPRSGVLTRCVLTAGTGEPPFTTEEAPACVSSGDSGPVVARRDLMNIEVGASVAVVNR